MKPGAKWSALLPLLLLPAPVPACSCAPSLGCDQLPNADSETTAVFVGTVREFYPRSRDQMNQIMQDFYHTHQDLVAQLRNPAETRRRAGEPAPNLEFRKQLIQYIWGNTLTPAEEEQLRTATAQDLDRLHFDYWRRARFAVVENFVGANGPQFELFTNLDGPSCGFDFAEGGTYLVRAYRNLGDERWQVSSCSRTRAIANADEDVRMLRTWKAGIPLPARILGIAAPGLTVRLRGSGRALETSTDSQGRFEFKDLPNGTYEVEAESPPNVRRRAVDLTRGTCAEVILPRDR
jgi:hypothetical protein